MLYFPDKPVAWKLHATKRLGTNTASLVLTADSGRWPHRITSPRHRYEKTYLVTLEPPAADDTTKQFAKGVQLHNKKDLAKPAMLEVITPTQVRLTISEGYYHQARRMFAVVSNHVVELHRECIGGIALGADLTPGGYRPLTEEGIASVVQLFNDFREPAITTRQYSLFAIVFTLGLLAILMPLSINMCPLALPVISAQFGVPADSTQMTLSIYILGFVLGQLIYGPMVDSFGRKSVVLGGILVFAATVVTRVLVNTIDQLIVMCFFHELVAAAANVVINAPTRDIHPREEFSRMMSFIMPVTTIVPLMAPIVGGWVLVWPDWHYIFWILTVAAILASTMIFFLIKETLPPERRQPFYVRTTTGSFAALSRHRHVLSYMLASSFSFVGVFSFLNARLFVYIKTNHVASENLGYYFALNILFLFVMAIFNSCFIRHTGALDMLRSRLWIQFIMTAWTVINALLGLGFWSLVVGVAASVGCVSMVLSSAMAVILGEFPHMAETVSSLAETFRFGIGAIVGVLFSLATFNSARPVIWSIAFYVTNSILFCSYASRPKKR